jgi:uncharacterized iron-regulated membrane protein
MATLATGVGRVRAVRRPLAFVLHSLVGLKLSLFLGFVCLTGTIATVSHEIEWLLLPKVRASAPAPAPDHGAMWAAVQAAYPQGWVRGLSTYDRADGRIFAWRADVALPDGAEIAVLVDPATARITGEQRGVTFHSFMRGLHYYLFTPGDWGFYLVTSLGFALAASLVSGLILYKRFWAGFRRRPRFHRDIRTWTGDLHRLMALWSLWFVAVMSVTAIWYLVERAGVNLETDPPSASSRSHMVQPDGAAIRRWVSAARAEMAGLRITSIQLPWGEGEPAIVQGQWKARLVRERTNAVFLEPATGDVLGVRIAHELGAGERWVHTADPLHFGNFAGLAGKLVWVACGVALTGLCLTGAIIHARRLAAAATRGRGA